VGSAQRFELGSRIATIIEHLAELQASPASEPRDGWVDTVERARGDVERLLKSSPSLGHKLGEVVLKDHCRALRVLKHHNEAPRFPIDQIAFTMQQVLGPWLPDDEETMDT
jgi:hypothetical protein